MKITDILITDFIKNCSFVHQEYACCKKKARNINYTFRLSGLKNGWNTIGTIPSKYAPYLSLIEFPVIVNSGFYGGFARILYQPDGSHSFTIYNVTNESVLEGFISYINK